jgi:uncharacterized membrane protein YgdD (TMEM256/DUF423 family)
MARRILTLAGLTGLLAVVLGAFGAHGLKSALKDHADAAQRLAWWDTGVDYHFWHVPLLLALGLLASRTEDKWLERAAWLTVGGLVVFSGSLYAMTLTGIRVLGAITPFGGTALIIAWAFLVVGARRVLPR